jgi:energy-coupling factor transporter ATP-binding protein EcfA2
MHDTTNTTQETGNAERAQAGKSGPHIALQRDALGRFLHLTAETAELDDSRVEQEYDTARGSIGQAYDRLLEQLQEDFRKSAGKADREHAGHVLYVREQYGEQITTLQVEFEKRCQRLNDETEAALRDARKTKEQDTWLAESVSDATREQIKRHREKLAKQAPQLDSRLDELWERSQWVLQQMGYKPSPAPAASDAESTSDKPAAPAAEAMNDLYEQCVELLDRLEALSTPRYVVGSMPYVLGGLLCAGLVAVAAAASVFIVGIRAFYWTGPVALALGVVGALAMLRPLRRLAQAQMQAIAVPLQQTIEDARRAANAHLAAERTHLDQAEGKALHRRETEARRAQDKCEEVTRELQSHREASLAKLRETLTRATGELGEHRENELKRLETEHAADDARRRQAHARRVGRFTARRDREFARLDARYHVERRQLDDAWRESVDRLQRLGQEAARLTGVAPDWDSAYWQDYQPAGAFQTDIRFGQLQLDLGALASCVVKRTGFNPASFRTASGSVARVPALLELPERSSLLIQTGQQGRPESIAVLQAIMARLLTSLPPGRVHFTIIDPVGLGENFAGFMHLVDYDEAMVNGRIWTDKQHIEQRLGDLTAHMENVIQKYLRNEFETIDAYNVQAGELAEPYRFLVIADFPANFTEEAIRRLNSIVGSGARCGVYTLIAHDTRLAPLFGIQMDDMRQASICVRNEDGRFVWQDDVFRRFPLTLDAPPDQDTLTAIMHKVGQAAGRAKRVEVPFEFITPATEQIWTASGKDELRVPVGRTGAVRLQDLRLGRGVAQHCLIAGKTGSGKSTLLHVLITNLVLWYPPDEVEFYLIDFKKGVEFKTYATHELPHARAIAIESDREFGLSVLHRLDSEMERRGEMFRAAGVQDLPGYRNATDRKLPRTLLIVDEFQMFFSEDDKLAQDAAILLDRLVRQGRAFGIHVILGSQTLGGTSGLPRSTIGQMAVRIALQCSEVDSQLIFEDGNAAARLLSRPGEAIYNDAGGLLQGNSPFQTAWLSDDERDVYLDRVSELWRQRLAEPAQQTTPLEHAIVFEGNAPADLRRNRLLADLLARGTGGSPAVAGGPVRLFLGEAVAIKDPTAATFRRQSGANLLLIGQRDDAALAILSASMISLAAQFRRDNAEFVILDGSSSESPQILQQVAEVLPQHAVFTEYRAVGETLNQIATEVRRRQASGGAADAPIFLFIYGLQRYRMFRRSEDFSFSMGTSDENAPPAPDKLLGEILREGPAVGVHVVAWADTPATVDRAFDRQTVREFDNRVLFQMSAADSSNLIDSPVANRLGFYRALFFSEEQGLLEKFRPYSLPDRAFLDELRDKLSQ